MLILSRKIGESLMLGDDIKVTIVGIRGNQIRIGVDADKALPVHREEVYDRIKLKEASELLVVPHDGGTLSLDKKEGIM